MKKRYLVIAVSAAVLFAAAKNTYKFANKISRENIIAESDIKCAQEGCDREAMIKDKAEVLRVYDSTVHKSWGDRLHNIEIECFYDLLHSHEINNKGNLTPIYRRVDRKAGEAEAMRKINNLHFDRKKEI